MPSVCNGHAPVVAAEGAELTLTKMVVSYIEKKYRNLDKRKAKLDGYHQKEKEGESLNKDQKEALAFRAQVAHTVETLKELLDQVTAVAAEEEKKAEKLMKKQAKRQQIEVHKERANLICELLSVQQTLRSVEDETAKARAAAVLTKEELGQLAKLRELIMPPTSSVSVSVENAELVTSYLEGKEGEYSGCSFQAIRDAVKRVRESNSLTVNAEEKTDHAREVAVEKAEEEEPEKKVEEVKEVPPVVESVQEEERIVEEDPHHPAPGVLEETEVDSHLPCAAAAAAEAEATSTVELPAARSGGGAAKKPQEIISSFRGNYNFLQESEIDESEQHVLQNTAAPVSGMYNPYAYIPHGDFPVPQSHTQMVGAMMPAQQHVPFTAYENQPTMYVPVGYNEHISAGYTLVSSYNAPIVSHGQGVIQGLPDAEQSNFEGVSGHREPVVESAAGGDAVEGLEGHEMGETAEAAAAAEAQKTFSMNPNADVFHSKNFPDGAGMMSENTQGCFNGKNRGRGGRGNPGGGYQGRGHRGGNYNGRGGGYPRYPRNDGYRSEGQNGYNPEFNSGWRGPRRGNRGGNGRGAYARGGHGGYDRNNAQLPTTGPEAQD